MDPRLLQLRSPDPEKEAGGGKKVDRGDEIVEEKVEDKKAEDEKVDEVEELDPEKAAKDVVDEEEAAPEPKKDIRIPKARFDEVQRKARAKEQALNTRIQELEEEKQGSKIPGEVQKLRTMIAEAKDKYEDLVLDGNRVEAKKIRQQVEQMEERLIDYKTAVSSDAARMSAIQDLKYDAALAKAESEFPELSPDTDSYDEEKNLEVATLFDAFQSQGLMKHAALQKAVKYVMGVARKPGNSEDTAAVKQAREKLAREKAAGADKKQPGDLNKAGKDSDKVGAKGEGAVDVMRLSVPQFDKLSEDTKARLRGDTL